MTDIVIVFGTVFFNSFWRLKIDEKISKSYVFLLFLSKKQQNWFYNFHNSGVVCYKLVAGALVE